MDCFRWKWEIFRESFRDVMHHSVFNKKLFRANAKIFCLSKCTFRRLMPIASIWKTLMFRFVSCCLTKNKKNLLQLTQNILWPQLVKVAELIIAVKHGRASHNRHKDYISGDVLGFETIARISPAMTQRLHRRLIRHQWIAVWTGAALVDAKHAGSKCDQCDDHFPWMRCAELAMSTKQASCFHHVVDLYVKSEMRQSKRKCWNIDFLWGFLGKRLTSTLSEGLWKFFPINLHIQLFFSRKWFQVDLWLEWRANNSRKNHAKSTQFRMYSKEYSKQILAQIDTQTFSMSDPVESESSTDVRRQCEANERAEKRLPCFATRFSPQSVWC